MLWLWREYRKYYTLFITITVSNFSIGLATVSKTVSKKTIGSTTVSKTVSNFSIGLGHIEFEPSQGGRVTADRTLISVCGVRPLVSQHWDRGGGGGRHGAPWAGGRLVYMMSIWCLYDVYMMSIWCLYDVYKIAIWCLYDVYMVLMILQCQAWICFVLLHDFDDFAMSSLN